MIKRYAAVVCALVLAGCASTPDEVRSAAHAGGRVAERRVDVPYPVAARRVLAQARKCWRWGWIGSSVDIDHDIGPDRAEIALVMNGVFGAETMAVVDMRPVESGTAIVVTVKATLIRTNMDSAGDQLVGWAKGETGCTLR